MDLKCPESAEGLEELEKMVPLCRKEVFRQVKAKVETQGISEREASRKVAKELDKPEATIRSLVREEKIKPKVDATHPPILTESDQRFILKEAKGIKKERRKERQEQREEQIAEMLKKDPPLENEKYKLILEDFRTSNIEPSSIDAIITDPPYGFDYIPLYRDLSEFASNVLKPDAPCLVMCGQSWLEIVLKQLSTNLKYVWTIAFLTPGASVQVFGRKIKSNWKPIIFLVNGKNECEHIKDTIEGGGRDKEFHDWGQNEEGMAQIIERFTVKGNMICDPFCGAGTTGVAALNLNRHFIGIDNDEYAIKQTGERLSKIVTGRDL